MKKLLTIVVLGLLWCNPSFAGCKDNINFKWWKDGNIIVWEFYNKGSKHIRITKVWVSDSDGDKIINKKATAGVFDGGGGLFVGKAEKKKEAATSSDAVKFGKTAYYDCRYQKPYEKTVGDRAEDLTDSVGDFFEKLFNDDDDD